VTLKAVSKKRYRGICLMPGCNWETPDSELHTGPVFAAWSAEHHVKVVHPDSEGFVATCVEVSA
jgi:hypothetical protein